MMALRTPLLLIAALAFAGCEPSSRTDVQASTTTPGNAANVATPPAAPPNVAGTYRVSGTTAEKGSDSSRKIDGTIVLTQNGDTYRASFQLATLYPGAEGDHQAVVIGKGEGKVQGKELLGTAHTQVVVAAIPGVDTNFAFAPRATTTRIESSSKATLRPDGTLVIEIENLPAKGEQSYRPSHTRLTGERIALASTELDAQAPGSVGNRPPKE
jgi:hypothetical protein